MHALRQIWIVAMAVIPWGGVHRVETTISVPAGQDAVAAASDAGCVPEGHQRLLQERGPS